MKIWFKLDLKIWLATFILGSILISCSKEDIDTDFSHLDNLPADTGGMHLAQVYNPEINPYGYYIYTPSGYENEIAIYPLLIFLHGSGEKGNSMIDAAVLRKVLYNGPPKLIQSKKWSPTYPMIVVSPQCHDGWWNPGKIHELISLICKTYRINTDRIYLTGLSMGAYGTYSYIETYADSAYVAAAVPICGRGNPSKAEAYKNIPIWAFHGDADKTVGLSNSINIVKAINEHSPRVLARLTVYPGVGHDSWSRTYNSSGMGSESSDYDAFNYSIYDWMFSYIRVK